MPTARDGRRPVPGRRPLPHAGRLRAAPRPAPAFSLMELMMVILILAVLAAMLFPAAHQAWATYQLTKCKTNLNTIYKAFHSMSAMLPPPNAWTDMVHAAGATEMLICPCDTIEVREEDYIMYDEEVDGPLLMQRENEAGERRRIKVERDGVLETAGGVTRIAVPPSAVFNDLESNTQIFMFTEQEDFELPTDVAVDIGAPGYYDRNYSQTGTVIPAGQPVNCYFLHFDSVGKSNATAAGSVTFREEILGIICMDGSLDATDPVLGVTRYDTGRRSRGYEQGAERVELSPDRRTFYIRRYQVTYPGEDCRILTKPSTEEFVSYDVPNDQIQVIDGSDGPKEGKVILLSVDTSSYAMNSQVKPMGSPPRQLLLLEFERTSIAESRATDFSLCFEKWAPGVKDLPHVAPRHNGLVNILTVEGSVRSATPEEIHPTSRRDLWEP